MKLEEMVQDLKRPFKLNRVIIINKKSFKWVKKFENLNIKKIDLSTTLSKLVNGFEDIEKRNEGFDLLKEFLESYNGNIIALDNIHYVFSEEIGKMDLISNLNYFTREGKVVILLFEGKKRGNELIYSEEGHDDYKQMDISKNEYVLGWEDES